MFRKLLFVLGCAALAGCIAVEPVRQEPSYKPAYGMSFPVVEPTPGSLFADTSSISLFDDRRARRVGDLVTIILEERTTSSKSAETSYSKGSATTVPEPLLFGNLIRGVASNAGIQTDIESTSDFSGEAESDQSNSLSGTVSVVVSEVLPNGLLVVQGEKWLNLNRGEEYVRVSGLVRPEDIDGANMVSSQRLADARIAYGGTGAFADSNKAGWLSRFFLSPINPF